MLALKSRSIDPTKLRSASEALSDTLMDNPFVNLFAEIEYIPEFELYVRVSPDDVKISKPDGIFPISTETFFEFSWLPSLTENQ